MRSGEIDKGSEKTLRFVSATIRGMPAASFVCDADGSVIDSNEAAEQAYGLRREGIIGRNIAKLVTIENELIHQAWEGEEFRGLRSVALLSEGRSRDVTVNIYPLRDLEGRVQGVVVALGNEASGWKPSESEELYRALSQSALVGIYIYDKDRFLYVNEQMTRITGYSLKELLGMSAAELVAPEDRKRVEEKVKQRIGGDDTSPSYSFKIIRKDKREAYIEVYTRRITYQGSEVTLGHCLDITHRIRAAQELRASEDLYRSTINAMGDVIHVVDRDMNLVMHNLALRLWAANLDIKVGDIIGQPLRDVFYFLPDRVFDEYRQVWRTGKPLLTQETNVIRDKVIITETRKIPVKRGDGKVERIVTVVRDITDRKRSEDEVRRRSQELHALLETSNAVSATLDENEVVRLIAERATQLIEADGCTVYRLDADKKELVPQTTTIKEDRDKRLAYRIPLGAGITGKAALERRPILLNNAHLDPRAIHIPGTKRLPRCLLVAPLMAHGELWGVMTVVRLSVRGFIDHDLELLTLFANQVADAAVRSSLFTRLRESEEKYRSLVEQARDGIVIIQDSKIVLANDAFTRLAGYDTDEVIGVEFHRLVAPEEREIVVDRYMRRMAGERIPPVYETKILSSDGVLIDVELSAGVIQYGGRPANLWLLRDVGERKRTEEALRLSEEFNRAVIESSPLGISVRGRTGQLLSYNEAWKRIWAMSDEDINADLGEARAGLRFDERDSYLGDWLEKVKRIYEEGGYLFIPEAQTQSKRRGAAQWVSHHFYAIKDAEGKVDRVVILTEDITQRKRALEALRESEERYRDLFQEANDAIFVESIAGRILAVNRRACEWYGYSEQELVRMRAQDLVLPEFARTRPELIAKLKAEGSFVMEEVAVRKGGATFSTEVSGRRIPWGDGEAVLVFVRDITERKLVEEAMREGERFLASIFASIQDGLSILDKNMSIIRVNAPMEKWYSHAMPLVGKKCYRAYHGRSKPCDVCPTARTLKTGESAYDVVPRRGSAGEITGWLDLYSFPLVDVSTGQIQGVIEYVKDITGRKKAEEALRESERVLSTLMSNLPGMAYRCRNDKDWTMEFVSEGCFALTGYEPSDLIDNRKVSYGNIIHPDDRGMVWEEVQAALEAKKPFQLNYRIISASGEEKWVWEQGRGVFSKDGSLLSLEGFITDVTDRRRAEEALRKSEELYRTLVNTAQEGISLVDSNEKILFANPKMAELLGYSPEELVNLNLRDLVTSQEFERIRTQTVRRSSGETSRYEFTLIARDGTPRHVLVNAAPILGAEGRFFATLGVLTDITDIKKTEEELRLRLGYQTALAEIMNKAIRIEDFDRFINECLGILGSTSGASRVYLAKNKDEKSSYRISHEWSREALYPLFDSDYQYSFIPHIHDQLAADEVIAAPVSGLPANEAAVFKERSTLSLFLAPLYLRSGFYGFIGVEECEKERRWNDIEIEALRTSVRLIGTVIDRYFEEEERRLAEEALASSEQRYRTLVETSSDIIFLLSPAPKPIYISPAVKRLGYSPEDLIARPHRIAELVSQDELMMIKAVFTRSLRDGQPVHDLDSEIYDANGEPHWFAVSWNWIRGDQGEILAIQGVARDITERKEAEKALRLRMEYEKSLFEISSFFLSEGVSDASLAEFLERLGRVTGVSRVYLLSYGKDSDGREFLEHIQGWVSEELPHLASHLGDKFYAHQGFNRWLEALSTGEAVHGLVEDLSASERKPFAVEGILSILVLPVFVEGRFWGAIGFDEAKRKREWNVEDIRLLWTASQIFSSALATKSKAVELAKSYEDLQERERRITELNLRLVKAEEDERQRIASVLHDEIAQQLTGVALVLSTPELASEKEVAERVGEAKEMVKETQKFIRDLTYELRPPALDNLGLGAAVRAMARSAAEGTGIGFQVEGEESFPRADPETEIMLYRIIQEAVNNALRHAEPEEIIIRFEYEEPLLRISIVDDGKGFDVEGALREAKGLGLRSIRERLVLVRGRLDIRSTPEGGTEVLVEVEIPRKTDKIKEEE